MTPRPIAVVLDGPPTPAWQARALAALDASAALDVVELRLVGTIPRGRAWRSHAAIERRIFRLGADPLAPAAVVARAARGGGTADTPRLVVWLAESTLPPDPTAGELLQLVHDGVVEPAGNAFRRAVLGGASCVTSELLLCRPGGETLLVERTVSGVRPFSDTLSTTLALWKLAALVPRAVERLSRPVEPTVAGSEPAPRVAQPAAASVPPATPPSALALTVHATGSWLRVPAQRLLFTRPWSVRVRVRGSAAPAEGWERAGEQLVRWRPGHVYADPFLFEHDGRHHLFCEEVPLGSGRGVISHTELHADGTVAEPPTTVLEAAYHLSYPFAFAHDGELYLIPETSAVGRVELYRAIAFPHAWEREAILLDGLDAVDATLLHHDNRWWLFAGAAAEGASSLDELHLFWADAPKGPWHRHPCNPVVSDVRCARPAGAIQRWGERLVRPGQDGSRRYGWATSFREVDVLSTTAYVEHEVARLEPAAVSGARATHTYAADGRFEAIDLRTREWRVRNDAQRSRRSSR